mmetsp:Transcript_18494/g.25991  ORF Transcript_18494/g.25991 Transcript_18494/m.25991 type:complete len:101 (-) Transcript_18494:221-523(-)
MEESSDSEYEETYVLVDLDCCLDAATIKPGKILGIKNLNSLRPSLSLDGKIYEGKFLDSIGTCMFFDEDRKSGSVKYFGKTWKQLRFQRKSTFVESKATN